MDIFVLDRNARAIWIGSDAVSWFITDGRCGFALTGWKSRQRRKCSLLFFSFFFSLTTYRINRTGRKRNIMTWSGYTALLIINEGVKPIISSASRGWVSERRRRKRAKPKEIFNFHFFFLWLRQLLYSLAAYIALEPTRQHSVSLRRRKKTINGSTRLIFAPEWIAPLVRVSPSLMAACNIYCGDKLTCCRNIPP